LYTTKKTHTAAIRRPPLPSHLKTAHVYGTHGFEMCTPEYLQIVCEDRKYGVTNWPLTSFFERLKNWASQVVNGEPQTPFAVTAFAI
jgi:hypothetical protein